MSRRRAIPPFLFWGAMGTVLLVVVGAVALTNTTLRRVEKDLPNTLLAQLYDLELIVEHMAEAAAVAELVRIAPGQDAYGRLRQKLRVVEEDVAALRETYVVDNLVQASAIYAIVAPAITDARLWLAEGVSGFAPRSPTTLEIVYGRISDAHRKARARQRESQITARRILDEQVQRLNRFLFSVNLLFFATLAITLLMLVLLVRQHVLQRRERTAIEERRRAEQRFRQLAEMLPQTVFEVDRAGRLTFANDNAAAAFGYASEALAAGLPLVDLFAPDERERLQNRIERMLQGAAEPPGGRYTALRRDGCTFPVLMFTSGVRQEGTLTGLRGIITDISEMVRLQEERDQLEAQYSQAQKMEAVGRLAGGLAHDLNNLLAPIIGYGELLLQDLPPDDERRRPVETIHQAGTKARDLIAQLLAFSRKQALEVKPLDLSRVVLDFEPLLRRTIREDVAIRLELADSPPPVRADARQMEQVLVNLAVNAQDAMPGGGTLTIETAVVELEAGHPALHREGPPGPHIMLAVRDTGRGMDAEVQRHIFEPFFTTKERGKGTGLGLSTVFGIVRQHGGRLEVDSRAGGGSVFRCYFPRTEGDAAVESVPEVASGDTRGSERVLVVEDNEEVRRLAVRILEKKGYTVQAAAGGADCLRLLDAGGEPVDLLLTDVVMPDTNGKALYEKVARRIPEVRVLYMSGYTDDAIVHHGVLEEGVAFIQKPFAAEALAAKVRAVLDA